MNSPASNEVALEARTEFNANHFREGIAQRCANILRTCHLNKLKMDYKINPVLACVALVEMEGLETFQSHIQEKLATLLEIKIEHVEVTVTPTLPEKDTKRQQQNKDAKQQRNNKSEGYLLITATINQQ